MPINYGAYQIDPFQGFNQGLANIGRALQYRREMERQQMLDAENKRLRDLQVTQAELGIKRTEAENLGTIGAYSEEGKPPLTLADAIAIQKKKEIEAKELDQLNKRITNYFTVGKSLKGTAEQKNKIMREWLSKDPNPFIQRIAPTVELEGDKVKYTVTITGDERNPDGSRLTNPDGSPVVAGIYDVEGEATGDPKNPIRLIASKMREEKGEKETTDIKNFEAWRKTPGNENKNFQDFMLFKGSINKSGLMIEMDDQGRVVKITQGELGKGDITTQTKTKLQEETIKLIEQANSMKKIGQDFKRDYLTYWGRIKQLGLNIASKGGADIGEEGKEYVGGMRAFVERVEAFYQKWRKEITGAQAVMKEIEMLRESVLNKKVSPDEFEASYNRMMDDIELSLKLKQELMDKGFKGKELGEKIDELFKERKAISSPSKQKQEAIKILETEGHETTEANINEIIRQMETIKSEPRMSKSQKEEFPKESKNLNELLRNIQNEEEKTIIKKEYDKLKRKYPHRTDREIINYLQQIIEYGGLK